MASSNRHWPSMFRSKPACNQPWQQQQQQQPDMINSSSSLLSGSGFSHKSPYSSGCEERSPEPKPRWNPKPEQIRILEAIFNSGMVNPPRDEIRRIRLQLQEYGQVGDANVFYWFQNRKSRSKNKQRGSAAGGGQSGRAALTRACASSTAAPLTSPPHITSVAPTSSSSSSSDRSSGSSKPVKPTAPTAATATAALGMISATAIDLLSPLQTPALAACQMYYHGQPMAAPEFAAAPEPFVLQGPQGYYLSAAELAGIVGAGHMHAPAEHSPGVFLGLCSEVLGQEGGHKSCAKAKMEVMHHGLGQWCTEFVVGQEGCKSSAATSTVTREEQEEEEKAKLGLLHYGFGVTAATAAVTSLPPTSVDAAAPSVTTAGVSTAVASSSVATSAIAELQGLADVGVIGGMAPMATARGAVVCINDVQCVNVPAMHLNVRLFGEAAVLVRSSGEPVLVDEFGITVEPLQQGAIYYVV